MKQKQHNHMWDVWESKTGVHRWYRKCSICGAMEGSFSMGKLPRWSE